MIYAFGISLIVYVISFYFMHKMANSVMPKSDLPDLLIGVMGLSLVVMLWTFPEHATIISNPGWGFW